MTVLRRKAAWPADVLIRFVNVGGAAVDLHSLRFATKWDYRGAPYAATTPYEMDGFNWRCLGCKEYGREGDTYNDPGYGDLREAREAAQQHAERCRATPQEQAMTGWEYHVAYGNPHLSGEELNALGRDSWELVSTEQRGGYCLIYHFKRVSS
ncbi:hypothetical protein GCM10009555_017100 [Acrocarpospora macrocephala]|uniref:Uncharacterized protein n=1 Tax=Acrocarpospora macrocephala TaxID=150177 RepID=A0A5M3WGF7_9ACTN|nr:hypothetical protein [Acrocarpospora macrocephala]GES07370.1 hypothetical protein Amac_009650 [Acrocarpospora macrocephala]